jgi:hypothetical protein
MQLTIVFEHWHLGDGNYRAFAVGEDARLSFELHVDSFEVVSQEIDEQISQVRDAEYEIVGRVIRQYGDVDSSRFPVLEAGWLRFYCPHNFAPDLELGTMVRLRGVLALDHYQWVEFLEEYPNPPDLFYGVRVTRVRQVKIPERLIQRSAHGMGHPTSVGPDDYMPQQPREVRAVGDESDGPAFSLLDVEVLPSGEGPKRPSFFAQ